MAKKDVKARKTVKTSHIVDSGYIHGSHRIVDTIDFLEDLLAKHGPDAELDVSAEDYDGYGATVEVHVNSTRLESDEEYAKRIVKAAAQEAANQRRQARRQQKAEEKARKVEQQERAELERLMKKYRE